MSVISFEKLHTQTNVLFGRIGGLDWVGWAGYFLRWRFVRSENRACNTKTLEVHAVFKLKSELYFHKAFSPCFISTHSNMHTMEWLLLKMWLLRIIFIHYIRLIHFLKYFCYLVVSDDFKMERKSSLQSTSVFCDSKITRAILEEITDCSIIRTYFHIENLNLWFHPRHQVRKGHYLMKNYLEKCPHYHIGQCIILQGYV